MRNLVLFAITIPLAAAPAYGSSIADLMFTLSPNIETGSPSNVAPDPDPPCLANGCALFYGTLTDTDVSTDPSYPYMLLSGISVSFSPGPASGSLMVDNTFYDSTDYVPGTLSGDSNYATDNSGNPPNSYTGAIFGIDIAPGTSLGVYTGTVTISGAGGLDDPGYAGFTVSQPFTVDVAPEPAAGSLSLAGLAGLIAGYGVKRKWRSSEAHSR